MNEFLSTLLQAVLIAAVPVIAGAAIKGVQAVARHLASKTDNELAQKYLKEVADAIEQAVSFTNQTYVDSLKKSDKFTKENQEEALSKSLEKTLALLTADASQFLEKAYGDLNEYLLTRIEPEVRRQKKADTDSIALGPITAVAPAETADVTTVAAATAAATAATVAQTAIAQVAAAMDEAVSDVPDVADDGGEEVPAEPPEHPAPAEPSNMEHEFYFGVPGVET